MIIPGKGDIIELTKLTIDIVYIRRIFTMIVNVNGGTISEEEKNAYIKYVIGKHSDQKITQLDINLDGDYVDLKYHFEPKNFERIRRITGYLVGTLDHWNNGKRAEERDRVKHDVVSPDVMEQI